MPKSDWYDRYFRGRWLVSVYVLEPLVKAQTRDKEFLRNPPAWMPPDLCQLFVRSTMAQCAARVSTIRWSHALVHARKLVANRMWVMGCVMGSMLPVSATPRDRDAIYTYVTHCQNHPGERVRRPKCQTP